MGCDTPKKLLDTIFYTIGLNCALRGGEEHRALQHSQLTLETLPNGEKVVTYQENTSKCYQGGLKDCRKKTKVLKIYENKVNPDRCPIKLYECYVSHCPHPLDELPGFYLRSLATPTTEIWFYRTPIGRHKLTCIIKDICNRASLGGYRTNHSLRSTAATRMFDANVDEQLISEITGHSSNAVRNYKRTSDTKRQNVNTIVQGNSKDSPVIKFQEEGHSNTESVSFTINLNISKWEN